MVAGEENNSGQAPHWSEIALAATRLQHLRIIPIGLLWHSKTPFCHQSHNVRSHSRATMRSWR
jgi:hypothetical protein